MDLYYFRFSSGISNFGDNLNAWLWPQLLPGLINGDKTVTLIGIGTLLNNALSERTPQARTRLVFSSGVGYGKGPLVLDKSYKVYCVRGPLSAQALGLDSSFAIADGALLLKLLPEIVISETKYTTRHPFAYMPHVDNAGQFWREICQRLGFLYIDPTQPINNILAAIQSTDVLLTEAMHGAIVADVLRTPWVPVITTRSIFAFKWQDWCQSLGLTYTPHHARLVPKYRQLAQFTLTSKGREHWNNFAAAAQLQWVARIARPQLSAEASLNQRVEQLQDKLIQLRQDIRLGSF